MRKTSFHQHPDGGVFVRTAAGMYHETQANFELDAGKAAPTLPPGYIERYYEPGRQHFLSDGENAIPLPLEWVEGDAYIASYEDLKSKKDAREAAEKLGG